MLESSALSITAERLRRSDLFDRLSNADLIAIAELCREDTYREGDLVLKEDDPADELFIVERGKLSLEKKVQIGRFSTPRNATITYVGPGELAGFSALTPPYIYSTSAICIEPARLIIVDGKALRDYLETHPAAGYKVMDGIASMVSFRYRQATQTLTYFLSVVSHELRSPLAAIQNYLQTMVEGFAGPLNPKQERMVRRSILRVKELNTLVGDVVDLARMRPEQIQADFQWFDPGEVGAEAIEDVHLHAAEKDVRIRVDPPARFEPIVGARLRMRQVFTNLLNNAVKFSPAGSTVVFRAWYEPDVLIFEVEDAGPGIPPEDLPHIFEDFYRASNVGSEPGSGLGLSIAKKIMEAHRGEILVKNLSGEEGRTGTCFTIHIPLNLKTPELLRKDRAAATAK